MTESRIALLSSLASLVLVAWLVLRPESAATSIPPLLQRADASTDLQLQDRILQLASRIDLLKDAVGQLSSPRQTAPAVAASATAIGDEALASLRRELVELRHSVQELAEAQSGSGVGALGHSLPEIHREFPTTDWAACTALLQRAVSHPGATELGYLNSDKSPVLGELLMRRPRDVLLLLGAPSRTEIENGRFRWTYESPRIDLDSKPEQHIWVTFEKGYVWDVRTDVSGS